MNMEQKGKWRIKSTIFSGAVLFIACSAPAQTILVATYGAGNIDEINPDGTTSTFVSGGDYPLGMAYNSDGDLFVAETADNGPGGYINEIAPDGAQSTFATGLDPIALAFNNSGDLFAADYRSGNIYEFTANGTRTTFATGFTLPIALTFDSAGDLFVGAGYGAGNGYITKIAPGGSESVFASGLDFPQGLAFDSYGNLFEADQGSGAVYEFTPGGIRATVTTLDAPSGLVFSSAGDLFISSYGGGNTILVEEVGPNGMQKTIGSTTGTPAGIVIAVPEPPTLALLGAGAALICWRAARKVNAARA